ILFIIVCITGTRLCAQAVRLSLQNVNIREFLKAIEQQTNYSFIYTKEQLQDLPIISINDAGKELFALLNEQLGQFNIGYTVEKNFITLHKKNQQDKDPLRRISGRVINQSRQPVAGATVQISNESYAATTNEFGFFTMPYRSPYAVIRVSGAELKPAEVSINATTFLEITVEELVKELDQTILIAYGKTTRRWSTGSISKVSGDALVNQPAGNLLAALQGRVPGLLITASSGAPGASFSAQIRGQNSVNPNPLINNGVTSPDNPLILINGVPFAPQNNSVNQLSSLASPGNLEIYHNPHGGISPFNNIDVHDIESIEVLKDADMTAIYGSRAANGIMLITTRRAAAHQPKLEVDLSTGINFSTDRIAMMNTNEYLMLRRQAFAMDSLLPALVPGQPGYAPELLMFDSTRNTDWQRYFYHKAAPVTSV
ncbi:MAG: hypothetical protein EOP49_41040, partial [Sphingobacteriales bacterium]